VRDWLYKNQFNGADRLQAYRQASVKLEWSFRMSDTSYGGRYLRDAGLADANEQPVSLVRIVVLVAVALPVFGGFYYAVLDYLLFG
jgi:hypothetical protein